MARMRGDGSGEPTRRMDGGTGDVARDGGPLVEEACAYVVTCAGADLGACAYAYGSGSVAARARIDGGLLEVDLDGNEDSARCSSRYATGRIVISGRLRSFWLYAFFPPTASVSVFTAYGCAGKTNGMFGSLHRSG